MAIGAMRHRVTIQSISRTSDGGGGSSIEWAKVADVYADIQPQSSRESEFGRDNGFREVTTHKVLIRYRSGLTTAHRLYQSYRSNGAQVTRVFNIKGILNIDNKNKILELSCDEGVPT